MAEALNKFSQLATTSMADAYLAPAGSVTVIMNLSVTNLTSSAANVTIVLANASASNAEEELVKNLTIPAQSTITEIAAKQVMKAGDKIRIQASAANAIRVNGSVTEGL